MSIETITPGKKYNIIYWPQGGKGARKKVTFHGSQPEAVKHHAELCRTHHIPTQTNPRIRQLWPDFLRFFKNDRLPSTVNSVILNFNNRLIPIFGDKPISQLTPTLFEQYKEKRLTEGVKKRTINKELSYFQSLIKWAVEQGLANPLPVKIRMFPSKHTKPPLPVIPTKEAIQAIYDNIRAAGENRKADKKGLFLLLYDGGLRVTEACTIKGENIDLGNGLMLVTGKGNKQRIVPIMSDRLEAELERKIKERGNGYLYISPQTGAPYKDIRGAIKNAAIRAGVDIRIYHHLFRHSFATHALEDGVNIKALQDMLGHGSVKMTERYTHIGSKFIKREGDKIRQSRINTQGINPPLQKDRIAAVNKAPNKDR